MITPIVGNTYVVTKISPYNCFTYVAAFKVGDIAICNIANIREYIPFDSDTPIKYITITRQHNLQMVYYVPIDCLSNASKYGNKFD